MSSHVPVMVEMHYVKCYICGVTALSLVTLSIPRILYVPSVSRVLSAGCGLLGRCSQGATSTGEHAGVSPAGISVGWPIELCLQGSGSLVFLYLMQFVLCHL